MVIFLRRIYASRYELRFAPLFLAKSKSTTNWSLYPKGLTLALKFCVTLAITLTLTLTLNLTLTPALKKKDFSSMKVFSYSSADAFKSGKKLKIRIKIEITKRWNFFLENNVVFADSFIYA